MSHYRPDIDGLRAVAVVPVVLYHTGVPFFSGGYVGVDVFFVISGFLITGLIWGEINAGKFSLWTFYERRARRILPALFFVLIVCCAVATVIFLPKEFVALSRATITTVFFASNFNFASQRAGYFDTTETPSALLHTWSLAVEEQFYLAFPLLLLAMRAWPARTVARVIAAITICSFAISAVGVFAWPRYTFYMLPTRAWELGVGSLLALGAVPFVTSERSRELLAGAGIAAILAAVFAYDRSTPFPGIAALLPVVGTAAIIHAGASGPSRTAQFLSLRQIVGVGLISYSLYLWHWPILVCLWWFFGEGNLSVPWMIGAIAASFALAVVSWAFVERPFRDRRRFTRRAIFAMSAATAVGISALCVAAMIGNGLPWRLPHSFRTFAETQREMNRWHQPCNNRKPEEFCEVGAPGVAPTLVLWGDSHAAALIPAVDAAARAAGRRVIIATRLACPPLIDVEPAGNPGCRVFNDGVVNLILNSRIQTVVLASRWAFWQSSQRLPGEVGQPRYLIRKGEAPSAARTPAAFLYGLLHTVEKVSASGREVVIVAGPPEVGWNVPQELYKFHRFGMALPARPDLTSYRRRNAGVDEAFGKALEGHKMQVVHLSDLMCTPVCAVEFKGTPAYFDDDHLSGFASAALVGPFLAKAMFDTQQDR